MPEVGSPEKPLAGNKTLLDLEPYKFARKCLDLLGTPMIQVHEKTPSTLSSNFKHPELTR